MRCWQMKPPNVDYKGFQSFFEATLLKICSRTNVCTIAKTPHCAKSVHLFISFSLFKELFYHRCWKIVLFQWLFSRLLRSFFKQVSNRNSVFTETPSWNTETAIQMWCVKQLFWKFVKVLRKSNWDGEAF